jgi:hypothetical protein
MSPLCGIGLVINQVLAHNHDQKDVYVIVGLSFQPPPVFKDTYIPRVRLFISLLHKVVLVQKVPLLK